MEREPAADDSSDPLAAETSQARTSAAARHEDELSPAKELRDRIASSQTERL